MSLAAIVDVLAAGGVLFLETCDGSSEGALLLADDCDEPLTDRGRLRLSCNWMGVNTIGWSSL